jgi:hypothetical protein
MFALAKLWTWTGNLFIPLAGGWAIYVRGGLSSPPPSIGVIVSRSYWGLLLTLAMGSLLIWVIALYIRLAKRKNASTLVPPNTSFEDEATRNIFISWGTVLAFALSITLALSIFSVRYAESEVYRWDDQQPLKSGFWNSRAQAHKIGCTHQPCFAIQQRIDAKNDVKYGVNEYILYLTDGVIVFLTAIALAGVAFIVTILFLKPVSSELYW